jgi:hypothetical protein
MSVRYDNHVSLFLTTFCPSLPHCHSPTLRVIRPNLTVLTIPTILLHSILPILIDFKLFSLFSFLLLCHPIELTVLFCHLTALHCTAVIVLYYIALHYNQCNLFIITRTPDIYTQHLYQLPSTSI